MFRQPPLSDLESIVESTTSSKAKPEISVIIPTYNRKRDVAKTIDSYLSQRGAPSFEVVIVDDGSTDGTFDFLRKRYGAETQSGKIRIMKKKNGGVSSARNAGIDIARGDYICIADSDDPATPNRLHDQQRYLKQNPAKRLVHAKLHFVDKNGRPVLDGGAHSYYETTFWTNSRLADVSQDILLRDIKNPVLNSSVFAEKRLLDELKARDGHVYDPHQFNAEDFDLSLRIAEMSAREGKNWIGFIDEYVGQYTYDLASKSRSAPRRQRLTKEATINKMNIRKHFGGRDPKLLVLTPKFTGGLGGVTVQITKAMYQQGFTDITFVKQPQWYGQKREYSIKRLDNRVLVGRAEEFFERGFSEPTERLEDALRRVDVSRFDAISIQGNQFKGDIPFLKSLGVPLIYTCHSLVERENQIITKENPSFPISRLAVQAQYELMEAADVIQVMSPAYGDLVLKHYPEFRNKLVIIENSAEKLDGNTRGITRQNNRLFTAPRLHPLKGHRYLVEAMKKVKRAIPDAQLYVAGTGPLQDDIRKQIRAAGLEDTIHLLGFISQEEMKKQYAAAEVYVHPALHENWSLNLHDAVNTGTPIICHDADGNRTLYENQRNCLKAQEKNPEDLARKIIWALRNPKRMQQFAARAQQDFEQYTWETAAAKYISVVENLTSKRTERFIEQGKCLKVDGKGRYAEALGYFQQAKRSRPHDKIVEYHIGSTLRLMGNHREAREILTKLAADNPRDEWSLYNLAKSHFETKEYGNARRWLDRCLEANPKMDYARRLVRLMKNTGN